jgi:hypothetical protein
MLVRQDRRRLVTLDVRMNRFVLQPSDEAVVTVDVPSIVTITTEPDGNPARTVIRDRIERLEAENRILRLRMQALEDELEVPPEHRRWKLPTMQEPTPT